MHARSSLRTPFVFWLAAPCVLAGVAALAVSAEGLGPGPLGVLAVGGFGVLVLLNLWPYHRVPLVDRLLAAAVAVLLSWALLDGRGRGSLVGLVIGSLPVLLLAAHAWHGDAGGIWTRAMSALGSAVDRLPAPPRRTSAFLVSFSTARFDLEAEPLNLPNEVRGRSFLEWLAPRLHEHGWDVGEPYGEDWGWALDVAAGERRFVVGASAEQEETDGAGGGAGPAPADWLVQVVLRRSLAGWWRGEELPRDDALVRLVVASAEAAGGDDLAVHPA